MMNLFNKGHSYRPDQRIILRAPKAGDIECLYRWRRDPMLQKYQPLVEMSHEQLKEDYLKFGYRHNAYQDRYQWMIEKIPEQIPIGWLTLNVRNRMHQIGEIGYSIAPEHHRKGYGYEALMQFLKIALNEIGLERIEAKCTTDNIASFKLLEKCGFEREGVLRKYLIIRGRRVDHFLYSYINHLSE